MNYYFQFNSRTKVKMFNFLKFTIMMILIGIILILLGMGAYMINNERFVSNDWLCMIGFLLLIAGALMIGLTMDGRM